MSSLVSPLDDKEARLARLQTLRDTRLQREAALTAAGAKQTGTNGIVNGSAGGGQSGINSKKEVETSLAEVNVVGGASVVGTTATTSADHNTATSSPTTQQQQHDTFDQGVNTHPVYISDTPLPDAQDIETKAMQKAQSHFQRELMTKSSSTAVGGGGDDTSTARGRDQSPVPPGGDAEHHGDINMKMSQSYNQGRHHQSAAHSSSSPLDVLLHTNTHAITNNSNSNSRAEDEQLFGADVEEEAAAVPEQDGDNGITNGEQKDNKKGGNHKKKLYLALHSYLYTGWGTHSHPDQHDRHDDGGRVMMDDVTDTGADIHGRVITAMASNPFVSNCVAVSYGPRWSRPQHLLSSSSTSTSSAAYRYSSSSSSNYFNNSQSSFGPVLLWSTNASQSDTPSSSFSSTSSVTVNSSPVARLRCGLAAEAVGAGATSLFFPPRHQGSLLLGGLGNGAVVCWDLRTKYQRGSSRHSSALAAGGEGAGMLPVLESFPGTDGHTGHVFELGGGHGPGAPVYSASVDGRVCTWAADQAVAPQSVTDVAHRHAPLVPTAVAFPVRGAPSSSSSSSDASGQGDAISSNSSSSSSRSRGILLAGADGRLYETVAGGGGMSSSAASASSSHHHHGKSIEATPLGGQRCRHHTSVVHSIHSHPPHHNPQLATAILTTAADCTCRLWIPSPQSHTASSSCGWDTHVISAPTGGGVAAGGKMGGETHSSSSSVTAPDQGTGGAGAAAGVGVGGGGGGGGSVGSVALLDARWSPKHATLFATGDANGRLSLFNMGHSVKHPLCSFMAVPPTSEQFFNSGSNALASGASSHAQSSNLFARSKLHHSTAHHDDPAASSATSSSSSSSVINRIEWDASGRFLYVGSGSGVVSVYKVHPSLASASAADLAGATQILANISA